MKTIGQTAIDGGFSILVDALGFIDSETGSNLIGAVTSPGSLTVFAPTNAAFGQLASDLGFTGDASDAAAVTTFLTTEVGAQTLKTVVEYHILGSAKTAAELTSEGTFQTLLGTTITIDGPTLIDQEPDLINPSLAATDISATNGIVHVIDKVLLPIDLPGNDAKTFTEIVLDSGTGFDTNAEDFDLLREAVVAAGLADALNDPTSDLTVFAPNDAAFIGLAQTLGFDGSDEAGAFSYIVDALRLLSKGEDPIPLLQTILTYHVGTESLQASQVLTGDPIDTLAGAQIDPDGTTLVDLDPDLPNPGLIATDIQAANGVLHVLDGVLIPADILQSDGSNAVDFEIGSSRSEVFFLGRDNDFLDAKGGRDLVFAGSGDDVVLGGNGWDKIHGGRGNDHLNGENGRDLVFGGKGDDVILGGKGADRLFGGSGEDTLSGERGRDVLFGGNGDDELNGGQGRDVLFGGNGQDTFVFAAHNGRDRVADFRQGQDVIDLTAFSFGNGFHDIEHNIHARGHDSLIILDGTKILLSGIDAHDLGADDFLF